MKCVVTDNCLTPKTECWACEDYQEYKPKDKRILSPRQERRRLERKAKAKEKSRSPASKRGRNNRIRGKAAERELAKRLRETEGLPVSRVPLSGALKAQGGLIGGEDNYAGDLILTINNQKYLMEVKTRAKLPAYVTNRSIGGIEGFCYIFTESQFLAFLHFGLEDMFEPNLIPDKKVKALHEWFDQDNSAVVCMREAGKSIWYYAVEINQVKALGGSC